MQYSFRSFISIVLFFGWVSAFTGCATRTMDLDHERSPSSVSFWPGRCEFLFAEATPSGKKTFDLRLFEIFQSELERAQTLSAVELEEAFRRPEAFLAILEHASKQQDQEGFHFRDALWELSLKERQQLAKEIYQVLNPAKNNIVKRTYQQFLGFDQLSSEKLRKLVVNVYRQIHKPRGFLKSLLQTKSLRTAFDTMDDQKIFERLETSLYWQGLNRTFASVMVDPHWTERGQLFYKQHQGKIKATLALGAWGLFWHYRMDSFPDPSYAGQVLDNLYWLPPFLPTLKYYFDLLPSEQDLLKMKLNDKATALNQLAPGWRLELRKDRRISYLKKTYFALFGIALLSSTYLELEHQRVLEFERQLQSQTTEASKILAMDPRERAAQETAADMSLLLKVQPNLIEGSPEYQRIYNETFESHLAAIQKK